MNQVDKPQAPTSQRSNGSCRESEKASVQGLDHLLYTTESRRACEGSLPAIPVPSMTSIQEFQLCSQYLVITEDIRGPAGRISLLLLVWKAADLAAFRDVAARIRAIRDVIDPLCGLKVVYLLVGVRFAASVLKAVRT